MKKFLFVFASTAFAFFSARGQNAIPNPGFESWTTQGAYDEPQGWGTINQFVSVVCFCKGTAVKTAVPSEVHSGTLAMKLKSVNAIQAIAPGTAATGTFNVQTRVITGGVPYNLRPDSIVGWYKYAPAGVDTASVDIRLSKWNTGTNTRDTVAYARFEEKSTVSSYTRFAKAFTYKTADAPDTMLIILLSSSGTVPKENSTMFLDDLGLVINNTAISENNTHSLISVYPNPASNAVTFSTTLPKFMLTIYDAEGKEVLRKESKTPDYRLDVANFAKGIYFYELKADDKTEKGKFAVQR